MEGLFEIPVWLDYEGYNNYPSESDPTTNANFINYASNQNKILRALTARYLWQPKTNYVAGDIIQSPNMPNGMEAVAIEGGATGATEPTWVSGTSLYQDSGVRWNLRFSSWLSYIATQNEAVLGENNAKAMTPERTKQAINALSPVKTVNGQSGEVNLDFLPVGTIIAFAGNSNPDGFALCNGGEVNRETYSRLFSVIGTTYGAGNGSTTFNLPNLIDRFIEGSSTAGSYIEAGLPNITGNTRSYITGQTHTGSWSGAIYTGVYEEAATNSGGANRYAFSSLDASKSNSIYGSSDTVQPNAITARYYIKY